jgi:ribosomal protein S7
MVTKNGILVLDLYDKLLGFLIKKGNKKKAKLIVNRAFFLVSNKTGYSMAFLLFKLFSKLNVFVEAKKVSVRRRSHIVPFSLGLKRRSYLIIKWLIKAILENNDNISISDKMAKEIFLLIKTKKAKSLKFRNFNNTVALANRSNIHYRW